MARAITHEGVDSVSECWRVVETYGTHKMVGGIRQVITKERWHGPFLSETSAKKSSSQLARNSASGTRNGEVSGYFAIEKGTITWQET